MPNQMGVVDEPTSAGNKSRMRHPPIVSPLYRFTGMLVHGGRVEGVQKGRILRSTDRTAQAGNLGREGGRSTQKRMEYPEIGEQLSLFPLTWLLYCT